MFRATSKKRKKNVVTRLRSEEDEEEDNKDDDDPLEGTKSKRSSSKKHGEEKSSSSKIKKSKKKKGGGGVIVRSFELGEGDDDEDDDYESGAKKKKKKKKDNKKRKRGLGFGGGASANLLKVHDEDDDLENMDIDQNEPPESSSSASNVYGKEALEKLKQEQKYRAPESEKESSSSSNNNNNNNDQTQQSNSNGHFLQPPSATRNIQQIEQEQEDPDGLGDYVPLDGRSSNNDHNMILTGDEALDFEEENRKKTSSSSIRKEEHFDTVTMEDPSISTNFLFNNNNNDDVDRQDQKQQQQAAEEASAWEAEISRRAGIIPSSSNNNNNSRQQSSGATTTTTAGAMSLIKLRNQIQSTITQINVQQSDVDRACERRKIELDQTQLELGRQQKELTTSGTALEFYQSVRENLANWTGALRDLQSKIRPIQDALVELDVDCFGSTNNQQWRDWEDDICSILHRGKLLDRVLGRQPPDFVFEETTTYVDEFGRDVKSQHSMNREKRMRRRFEIQRQQQEQKEKNYGRRQSSSDPMGDDDEVDVGMLGYEDIHSFQERRTALSKALEIALQELDDEYLQLPKLASVFREWRNSHPEDYKQCFANLSLGDLACVLVQVELCKSKTRTSKSSSNRARRSNTNGADDDDDFLFAWVDEIMGNTNKADADGEGIPEPTNGEKKSIRTPPPEELVDRVIEKAFVPFLSSMLDKRAYNLTSKKQSSTLSGLYTKLSKLNSNRSNTDFDTLTRKLFDYIKTCLEDVAIVILNTNEAPKLDDSTAEEEDDINDKKSQSKRELAYAIQGATEGQLRRITSMMVNVIKYWSPLLSAAAATGNTGGADVIEYLLDFLSSRYLFLLSSLKTRRSDDGSSGTKDLFSRLWEVLRETKWLDQPGRMLQAAPLRAAATAYNIS